MISALQKIRLSCWLHLIKTWVWVQYRLNYRLNYRVCMGWNPNDEKQWKAGPVLFVFEMKLARMPEETVIKLKRSRQMFQVSYNSFYFILSYWCHTNSLNISRPYWPWNTRTRGFHVRNFWPWRHVTQYAPTKIGKYPSDIPQFSKLEFEVRCKSCFKNLRWGNVLPLFRRKT